MCNIILGRETVLLEFGLLEMVHVILLSEGELQMFWFWSLWKVKQMRPTILLQHSIGMWVFYCSFSLIYTFTNLIFLWIFNLVSMTFFLYRVRVPCLQQVVMKEKSECGTDMVRQKLILKIECINWPLEKYGSENTFVIWIIFMYSCLSDWN